MSRSTTGDAVLATVGRSAAIVAGALSLLMLMHLALASMPAFREIGVRRMLTDGTWHPAPDASGSFTLVPAVAGTLSIAALAITIALPLGVLAALGATFLAHGAIGRAMDVVMYVLAGIPSVVLGLWGLTTVVPIVGRLRVPGTSVLAAGITLSIMVVPTIYVASTIALRSVPRPILDAARAMGLSRWATIRSAVLPLARPGLAVGAVLALARALGETMAVVMVAGNVAALPRSLFDPARTLTAAIALEMAYATGTHRAMLYTCGVLLMVVSAVLILLTRRLMPEPVHA